MLSSMEKFGTKIGIFSCCTCGRKCELFVYACVTDVKLDFNPGPSIINPNNGYVCECFNRRNPNDGILLRELI